MRKIMITTAMLVATAIVVPSTEAMAANNPVDALKQQAQAQDKQAQVKAAKDHAAKKQKAKSVKKKVKKSGVVSHHSVGNSNVHPSKPQVDKSVDSKGRLKNVDSVVSEALRVTGKPQSWKPRVKVLVKRESGNRPKAMNAWDSNAAQGYDMRSKGLAQTIGPTFRANHEKGTSWNIFDPVANVAAALNYIDHRYGTIYNVQQANPNLPPKGY